MNETREKATNLILGLILARLAQTCPPPPKKNKKTEKLIMQTQENGEKTHLGSLGSDSDRQFFSKNLAPSVTRYYGQLLSCIISEKTND